MTIKNAEEARKVLGGFIVKPDKDYLLTEIQKHFEAKGYLAALEGPEHKAALEACKLAWNLIVFGHTHQRSAVIAALDAVLMAEKAAKKEE